MSDGTGMAYAGRLTREAIVAQAIVLLNEGGLEAVSLRRIAARLGVQAPSLARHVGDKGQLLVLMSGAIFNAALDLIPSRLSGDDWLLAFGHALRRKQAETRDIGALLAITPPDGDTDTATTQRLQAMMHAAGLSGPDAQLQQAAIQALVTGWMTFEKSARAELFAARVPGKNAFDQALNALVRGFGG